MDAVNKSERSSFRYAASHRRMTKESIFLLSLLCYLQQPRLENREGNCVREINCRSRMVFLTFYCTFDLLFLLIVL